ncbi:MAG TPA: GtrA family protein [Candidatus Dwaynia gallinarum]|nr:GtrA family protein [Candidatus Dwaynia gallinarum]
MELFKKIKNTFLDRKFVLFVLIGIINTFNGVIFSFVYSSFLNENLSFVLGYISGLIIAYILNSFITFKERLSFKKFSKFAVSYIPNFIIQNVVVILIFNVLGLHKLLAYTLAAVIGIPITFILLKFFAFNRKRP